MRLTIMLAVFWVTLSAIGAGPAAASEFSACVANLKDAAVRAGVSPSLAAKALDVPEPDETVLRVSKVQPEFKTPIWDYLGFLVDEQRVEDGRAMMRAHDQALRAAERQIRCRPPRDRGGLGGGDRLRTKDRRQLPAPCLGDAGVPRRAARGFLARPVARGAEAG